MSRLRGLIAAIVVASLAAALPPNLAAASDGHNLTGLRVGDGLVWHATDRFLVEWDPNPPGTDPVDYVILDGAGHAIPGYTGQTTTESVVGGLTVPPVPGVYLFRAWNQNLHGFGKDALGPVVTIPLYFDDARPAPVSVSAPTWIAAGESLPVRVSHPSAPLPISGIKGYAVSIDAHPDGLPCAHADRCGPAEIALTGGIDDDSVEFTSPPEGIGFVHAVAVSELGDGVDGGGHGEGRRRRHAAAGPTRRGAGPVGRRGRCGSGPSRSTRYRGWPRPGRTGRSPRSPSTAGRRWSSRATPRARR